MNSIEHILLTPLVDKFPCIVVRRNDVSCSPVASLGAPSEGKEKRLVEINFGEKQVGELELYADNFSLADQAFIQELTKSLAPLLNMPNIDFAMRLLRWVAEAKTIAPEICNWTGIYFKESFLFGAKSEDLLLGPFLGESTEHIRISLHSGFCGLALSEERLVNVDDVSLDSRHIACSLKTRSEIVIPLQDKNGQFIAELDIDSHRIAAFSAQLENRLTCFARSFADIM